MSHTNNISYGAYGVTLTIFDHTGGSASFHRGSLDMSLVKATERGCSLNPWDQELVAAFFAGEFDDEASFVTPQPAEPEGYGAIVSNADGTLYVSTTHSATRSKARWQRAGDYHVANGPVTWNYLAKHEGPLELEREGVSL